MAHTSPRFLCDSMLGRLAKKLRMLGLDSLLVTNPALQSLLDMALLEKRILLTRRAALRYQHPGRGVSHIFIRSNDPAQQIKQVMAHCGLKESDLAPFSICLRCNQRLRQIGKQEAVGQVPEYVLATVADFRACPQCRRIYWKGTHHTTMQNSIPGLRKAGKKSRMLKDHPS